MLLLLHSSLLCFFLSFMQVLYSFLSSSSYFTTSRFCLLANNNDDRYSTAISNEKGQQEKINIKELLKTQRAFMESMQTTSQKCAAATA